MEISVAPSLPTATNGAKTVLSAADAPDGQAGADISFAELLGSLAIPTPAAADELAGLLGETSEDDASGQDAGGGPLINLLAGLLAGPSSAALAADAESDASSDGNDTTGVKKLALTDPELGAANADEDSAPPIALGKDGAKDVSAAKLADAALIADKQHAQSEPAPDANGRTPAILSGVATGHAAAQALRAETTLATHVGAPVGSPGWATDFGQRMVMLARSDSQSAQITLNPAHLGPIEVRLSLSGGEATAVFTSPHHDVREALETALPRLREMFASAGIELGQAQVNSQSGGSRDHSAQQPMTGSLANRASNGGTLADNEGGRPIVLAGRGLVDTYA